MVRLPKEPFWTRRTIVSFGSCVSAGIIILLLWWLWPKQKPQLAYQRDVREITATWRCLVGHPFSAPGSLERRPCPTCSRQADIEWLYHCLDHGDIAVRVRYRLNSDGRAILSQFSFDGLTWHPISDGLNCPQCGQALRHVP